ncbi:TIGR02677 family protein [Streptomyces cavernae]|uniref:TIGR02677 family protein n=1 Tax=Streptomyces cavernae TaxID=2259034 RepID=UPI001EE3AF62|nr:TIGR02677 family protein [Streptomyces cavernae]
MNEAGGGEVGVEQGVQVPADMFRCTTGERAPLYSAVLQAFGAANEHRVTTLTPDEVRRRLRDVGWCDAVTDDDLLAALRQLHEWRLLDATQAPRRHHWDTGTAEEHERSPVRYSLTRHDAAAFAGVRHTLTVLTSSGAVQTALLDAIADRLTALADLPATPATDGHAPAVAGPVAPVAPVGPGPTGPGSADPNDPGPDSPAGPVGCGSLAPAAPADPGAADHRIFTTLQELEGHLAALDSNTSQFNGELQHLLQGDGSDGSNATDLTAFREVKAATVAYLLEFLGHLDRRARAVAGAVAPLEELDVATPHRRAPAGAELPPRADGDSGPAWIRAGREHWETLRAWFLPEDGTPARVEELHHAALRAILTLLQVLDRITRTRHRTPGAAEDFRELARWFAAVPSEDDAHRLWATAFGLGSARHAHLTHADPETVPPSTSWREAPPVEVSALLRSSGRTERFTRTGRVRDVTAVKAARAERARAERAELEAAWELLRTTAPIRLSSFAQLDHRVFERLLDLLGRALAVSPDASGLRRAVTGDGWMEVVLGPPSTTGQAVLHTSEGRLTAPDYVVEIRRAGDASHRPGDSDGLGGGSQTRLVRGRVAG